MKWLIFSLLISLFANMGKAQSLDWAREESDSLMGDYEKRVYKYQKRWHKLIPTHTVVQYAGSIGLFSAGLGWDYGKRNQWETTALLGYLPKYDSNKNKVTFTLKQNFTPWSLEVKPRWHIEPLTCGLFLNTIISDEFWVKEPDKYPHGYYGFSTRMRTHIFVGQRLTHFFNGKNKQHKSITAYYELNTCDFYIISLATNPSYLKFWDIFHLGFGIKFQVF